MWTQWKGHVLDLGRGLDEAAGTAPVETSGADALASGAEAGVPAGSGEVEMPGAPGVPPPSTGETAMPELGVPTGPGGLDIAPIRWFHLAMICRFPPTLSQQGKSV